MEDKPLRKIRSFVRRPGRTTAAQSKALVDLIPRYGVDYQEERLDLEALFGRSTKTVLDIGFGDGEALLTAAANNPETDYLGVEVHDPGVGHLLLLLERAGLTNVRVIRHDAVEVLDAMLGDACLDGVNVFFPDPWPKKRHHKRRLIQPPVALEFARVLRPGGILHIATDWENYSEHIREVIGATAAFAEISPDRPGSQSESRRPPTKFERRGQKLGHSVWDLTYERLATSQNR